LQFSCLAIAAAAMPFVEEEERRERKGAIGVASRLIL